MKWHITMIEVEFGYQPNDDIYTASYDSEMWIDIPQVRLWGFDAEEYIKNYIMDNIEVSFDTPDAPDFEINDVIFNYYEVEE